MKRSLLTGFGVVLALSLAACGINPVANNGVPTKSTGTGVAQAPSVKSAPGSGYLQSGSGLDLAQGGTGSAPANPLAIVIGTPKGKVSRSVSGAYQCDTGKFQDSFNQVVQEATTLGGYVATSDTQPDSTGRIASGSVTVKVPSGQLEAFIGFLNSKFQLSSMNFSTDDQTAQFISLSAALTSAQAHEAALQNLLSKAQSIADISSIEEQIAQVQTQENTYQGQINAINNQVDYATASITINEKGVATTAPSPIWSAVTTGWNNLVAEAAGLVASGVTLLPLILIGLFMWKRRKGFSNPSSPAAPGTPVASESAPPKNPA